MRDDTPVLAKRDLDAVGGRVVDQELANVTHVVVKDGRVRDVRVFAGAAEAVVV